MDKVLIISPSLDEEKMLIESFGSGDKGEFVFETTASFSQPADFWFKRSPKVLILSMPLDGDLQEHFFEKLKSDMPVNQRIIFLCPGMSPKMMKFSTLFERVRLLKSPVQGEYLKKSILDLTTDFGEQNRQIHPRYATNVEVEVFTHIGAARKKALMKNLSIGGAYVEVAIDQNPYKIGELLQVSIELVGLRYYQFDARIVWNKDLGGNKSFGYGLAFINKEEVYDTLLSGVGKNL